MNTEVSKADRKDRFIELRAKEHSFDYIAKELSVSKPTLISWSKELKVDISNLREINRDYLRENYAVGRKHRLEMFSEQLKLLKEELAKRDLSEVPTSQLLTMIIKIESRIAEIDDGITHLTEEYEGLRIFGDTNIDNWNG